MYLVASFSVWILDSLSEGSVGMIFRSCVNASFRDWVLCRSLTFARTRWFWRSSKLCGAGAFLGFLEPLARWVALLAECPVFAPFRLHRGPPWSRPRRQTRARRSLGSPVQHAWPPQGALACVPDRGERTGRRATRWRRTSTPHWWSTWGARASLQWGPPAQGSYWAGS